MDFLRDPPDVLRSFPPSSTPQQSSTTHVQLPPGVDSESRVAANGFGVTLRHVVDVQTASSVRRLPGLASSGLMLEVVNGTLDEFTDADLGARLRQEGNEEKVSFGYGGLHDAFDTFTRGDPAMQDAMDDATAQRDAAAEVNEENYGSLNEVLERDAGISKPKMLRL